MIYHMLGLFLQLYSMQLKVVMSFTSSLQQHCNSIQVRALLFVNYVSQENGLGRTC